MQELQPYFPEPIITAKMLEKTKHSFKQRERSAAGSKKENKSSRKFLRKIILIIFFIFLGTFLIFFFQNQGQPPEKSLMKHLKFVPKNKTLTAKSSTANKLSEFDLEDMMQSFGSNIPVQESSERLKKMITASPEILENIANNILLEIGCRITLEKNRRQRPRKYKIDSRFSGW